MIFKNEMKGKNRKDDHSFLTTNKASVPVFVLTEDVRVICVTPSEIQNT